MKAQIVGIVILYDLVEKLYTVVRSDHLHPDPSFRYKIKGIGGLLEPGEDLVTACLRELDEEFPDVWTRDARKFVKQMDPNEIMVFDADGGISTWHGEETHWVWQAICLPADLSRTKYYLARARSTESNIEFYTIGTVPPREQCGTGFYELIDPVSGFLAILLMNSTNP